MANKKKQLSYPNSVLRAVLSGVKLTVQSLLESLHTHHVLGELEGLAFGLDSELSMNKETRLSSAKNDNLISSRYSSGRCSPGLIQQLLLICNVTFVAHGQKIHG